MDEEFTPANASAPPNRGREVPWTQPARLPICCSVGAGTSAASHTRHGPAQSPVSRIFGDNRGRMFNTHAVARSLTDSGWPREAAGVGARHPRPGWRNLS